MGGFDGTTVTPELKTLIVDYKIGGIILFKRNIQSLEQVRDLIAEMQDLAETPLFIGVDQEGGGVFRLGPPFTVVPPMEIVGEYYRRTKHIGIVREIGRILARELRSLGFNWDYAPVVDVHSNPNNPVIGNRSFGPDPKIVARCASALIRGLHEEGVLSCAKHFPGHGATDVDSHFDLPVLKAPGRLIWKRDLVPYHKLISQKNIPAIMTAHVRYPSLDPTNCATLSHRILTKLLRQKMKYKGLVVSDDLWMKAVSDRFGIPDAALRFFKAGGDLAMICREPKVQFEAIDALQKEIAENPKLKKQLQQSRLRINRLKKRFCSPTNLPSMATIGSKEHAKIVKKLGS